MQYITILLIKGAVIRSYQGCETETPVGKSDV